MKVLTNYFQSQTQTQVCVLTSSHVAALIIMIDIIIIIIQVRQQFQNEYNILCQLPPHEYIIHMWAFFFDRANPDISPEFRRVGRYTRTMSLFLLMDEHPMNMKEHVDFLVNNQGPKVRHNYIIQCIYHC